MISSLPNIQYRQRALVLEGVLREGQREQDATQVPDVDRRADGQSLREENVFNEVPIAVSTPGYST